MNRYSNIGFTLIELMIVVAIIGLLGAIALPSYQASVQKGRRAEGRTALTEFMQQQERYMTQTNSYAAFAVDATTGAAASFKKFSGDNLASASYLLGAERCDAPNDDIKLCVRVFAVPQFTDTDAGTLQVLSTGTKRCTGSKISVCWK